MEKLLERNLTPVSQADGLKLQKEIGAMKYLECSALTQINVNEVFEETIRALLSLNHTQNSSGCCSLL